MGGWLEFARDLRVFAADRRASAFQFARGKNWIIILAAASIVSDAAHNAECVRFGKKCPAAMHDGV